MALLPTQVAAQAAGVPDAGSLRQQIEQPREFSLPRATPLPRPKPAPEIKTTPGLKVTVKSFRFVGNHLLTNETLAQAVEGFRNTELGFTGLQQAADLVAAAYRQAGWLVRVYLPEQDVSEGVITLQIVEAVFSGVRFEGESPKLVSSSELAEFFKAQAVGQPINADVLDRALLLADDLPGVSVAGTLTPGPNDGETDLVLQTTDEPTYYGDVGFDNTGAYATGSHRTTANLSINSPGRRGELISLSMLKSEGSQYGRFSVTVPYGHNGLRLGANLSRMDYHVVNGPGAVAKIEGGSGGLGVELTYPIIRSRQNNLYLSSGFDQKSFFTQDSTTIRSDYQSNSKRVGLSGNFFDDWWGGGANSGSIQALWGQLSQMHAHTQLDSIDRNYSKLIYAVSRQQSIAADHTLLLSFQGQYASKLLDSSEKLYLGGAQSVRAYPVSEIGGDQGNFVSTEWRWRLDQTLATSAFLDSGTVRTFPTTSGEGSSTKRLSGGGFTFTWSGPFGLVAKLTVSRRIGANPNANPNTGADSDGTLHLNRTWLSVNMPF